jgi:UDP-N-acetylmuramoyl-tripeptide--D-alanyl-D-alanine ligase
MNAMAMMTLQQAQHWIPSGRLVGDATVAISRVHTDTRTLEPGDLFVALRGERFDGGQFLAQAASQGAVAALCEPASQELLAEAGLPGMIVPDAKAALGALASGWRKQFSLPLIAVTGSNGKTTVTQMIAAILRAWKGEGALATQGNFNNDIGVPLTLLRLRAAHEAAVVEMGMNHPGEIALLAGMTAPTVALVNNAQREHLEYMATVEAVARENGSVIESLGAQGVAVFPADDFFCPAVVRALRSAQAPDVLRCSRRGVGRRARAWGLARRRLECGCPHAGGQSEFPPGHRGAAQRSQRLGGCELRTRRGGVSGRDPRRPPGF